MFPDTVSYLRQKKMYVTPARCALLLAFFEHQGLLSYKQVSAILGVSFDRATIYRTVEVFLQKNIIHALPGTRPQLHYALSKENTGYSSARCKKHLYFICRKCGTTMCIETVPVPSVRLPDGFTGTDIEVIVKGVCCNCQKNDIHK
ncbi:MAG: transcriptional repressor [Chitinophagaceae bacterium]|nr:transcriptional repressor [Chitinophagaceae bacterium]